MAVLLKKLIQFILGMVDLRLTRVPQNNHRLGVNLNVGCGSYEISGYVSVDFYTEHYYTNKKFNRVHYDMRNDDLPFKSESVDTIYCSHVIEHIETIYVSRFFEKSFRVLKKGGVLRIACPDSLFLFRAAKEFPEYYCWHPMYNKVDDAMSCFVDEVATHRVHLRNYGLKKSILEYDYDALMKNLREAGEFVAKNPGRHINNWDFKRLKKYGNSAGFLTIIESKNKASCCPELQGADMDLSHPEMSLYADFVKT
jgi:predicted SAM-dependent methyltransferase